MLHKCLQIIFCYNLCVGFVQYNLLFQEEILLVGGKKFPDEKVKFYKTIDFRRNSSDDFYFGY